MKTLKTVKVVRNCNNSDNLEILTGFNRPVSTTGLKAIAESMKMYGFSGNAIIIETKAVDGKPRLFIADGQHRIRVAMENGILFHYEVVRFENEADDTLVNVCKYISCLNSSATKWSPMRFLSAFANVGLSEYETVRKAKESMNLTMTDLQNIFQLGCSASEVKAFKDGEMKFPDLNKSNQLIKAIERLRDIVPNKSFVRRSLFRFLIKSNIDIDKLTDAIIESAKYVSKKGKVLPENEKAFAQWLEDVKSVKF